MTRTKPLHLASLALVGVVAGWLVELFLASNGRAVVVPPIALGITLLAIGVLVVALAVPVRRVARGRPGATVDPIYATRVLVLAKAASLTAALLTGGMLGLLLFLVTRAVVADATLWPAVVGVAGSAALLIAGIVAEGMCRIPPGGEDDRPTDEVAPDLREG